MPDYDVIIIGAGLSGLAAGIRLAHFGQRVRIFERHLLPGGLNSYFPSGKENIDVGLHALTNLAPEKDRSAPLNKLLRQLRLSRSELQLQAQNFSLLEFPGCTLRLTNDFNDFKQEIARAFPQQLAGFQKLLDRIRSTDYLSPEAPLQSTRAVLAEYLTDELLREMLLCPVMFYSNPQSHDMDFNQFCVIFTSIFLEGLGRPRNGMQPFLNKLLRRFRDCGGELTLGNGISEIVNRGGVVSAVIDDRGVRHSAKAVISSIGSRETANCCQEPPPEFSRPAAGQLSFTETIFRLKCHPRDLGLQASIIFRNRSSDFRFAVPEEPVDYNSQIFCLPGNFQDCDDIPAARQIRLTHLANPQFWLQASTDAYRQAKEAVISTQRKILEQLRPGCSEQILHAEMFTPKTVLRYTGHLNGAIYGSPGKVRSGRCSCPNLFLCGTDQGFLGIVGALLSGTAIVNRHLLLG